MSYVIKAVLSSRNTGDQATIPFPIPDQEYDHTIALRVSRRSRIHRSSLGEPGSAAMYEK